MKISIDRDLSECVAIETRLAGRFGLSYCEVVPDLDERGLPLRALGAAGAGFLRRAIGNLQGGVIGFGHGRTLAAAVAAMPRMEARAARLVSLLGGLTRNHAPNPHDVTHRLAERTGAEAYVMPLPFFANSAEDRAILLSQRGVREVFDLAARADLMVVGIGTTQPDAQLVAARMVEPDEIGEVRARGGVAELLGHFLDGEGRPVETSLAARTVSPDLDRLRDRRIVALAGGASKVEAVRSALLSGFLGGLITDERTARALVGEQSVRPATKGRSRNAEDWPPRAAGAEASPAPAGRRQGCARCLTGRTS